MNRTVLLLTLLLATPLLADNKVAQHLQDISVTIRAGGSEGSGVIKTREFEGSSVNFVWTAAHVVDGLRSVKTVIAPDGTERKQVTFEDCAIVKELVEDGRRVGELKMDARVIRYSEKEDLALLQIRKKGFVKASVQFYLDPNIPPIGTPVYHVGSLLGQAGANSMTSGIVSQIGRVIDQSPYEQLSCSAFPGSSGGGVYLQDGRYVGMVVRGAGETFILTVPVRRIQAWAVKAKIAWALDDAVPMPSAEEQEKLPIEDIGAGFGRREQDKAFPVLIRKVGNSLESQ